MAKIAILGFGTVGSGVYEVLCRNAAGVSRRAGEPVEVKYILDPKDFSNHPAANLLVFHAFIRLKFNGSVNSIEFVKILFIVYD